jgi:endonuclease/exonuclease/phosphatase (EEP) superfamily protein YafD
MPADDDSRIDDHPLQAEDACDVPDEREQAMTITVSRRNVAGALRAATQALCLSTLIGLVGRWWPLELLCHFRVQYAVALVALALVWTAVRRPRWAAVALCGAAVNAWLIGPLYVEQALSAAPVTGRVYRAVTLNVDVNNPSATETGRFLEAADADLVLLVEPSPRKLAALDAFRGRYPHREEAPAEIGVGVAFSSRWPVADRQTVSLGGAGRPSIIARVTLPDGELTVVGTHPRTPLTPTKLRDRDRQLADVGRTIQRLDGPVMLLGDLNITSWSPAFRQLLRTTGLRDSRVGFGLQASWPTFLPPVRICIDHVLVSPEVVVRRRQVGPAVDSDHRPVVVEFTLERTGRPSSAGATAAAPSGA